MTLAFLMKAGVDERAYVLSLQKDAFKVKS